MTKANIQDRRENLMITVSIQCLKKFEKWHGNSEPKIAPAVHRALLASKTCSETSIIMDKC
jgi:hypothetical protein